LNSNFELKIIYFIRTAFDGVISITLVDFAACGHVLDISSGD
jgi:hypothetical protein